MLPREIFEILHAVMAILVLFQHFSGKLCLKFLTLNLSTPPNMVHFVRSFLLKGKVKRGGAMANAP